MELERSVNERNCWVYLNYSLFNYWSLFFLYLYRILYWWLVKERVRKQRWLVTFLLLETAQYVLGNTTISFVHGRYHFFIASKILNSWRLIRRSAILLWNIFSKIKASQRNLLILFRSKSDIQLFFIFSNRNVVKIIEVLELVYQSVVLVLLWAIQEHLMAALTFDYFRFSPELRVKFNDDIHNLLVIHIGFLTPYLEPFLSPPLILVTKFPTQFDAWFYFRNVVILDSLVWDTHLHILLNVLRYVLQRYGTRIPRILDMHDIVLLPLLEIIIMVLIEFLTLQMRSLQLVPMTPSAIVNIMNYWTMLIIERFVHFIKLLRHTVQQGHTLLHHVVAHQTNIIQIRLFRQIQHSHQALGYLKAILALGLSLVSARAAMIPLTLLSIDIQIRLSSLTLNFIDLFRSFLHLRALNNSILSIVTCRVLRVRLVARTLLIFVADGQVTKHHWVIKVLFLKMIHLVTRFL